MKRLLWLMVGVLGCLGGGSRAQAQAVAVTLRLDTNSLPAGASTVLHVYAQVVPSLRTNADRIFSWYVDVLNTNGAVVQADYAAMSKAASDRGPLTSSTGLASGADRLGVYDTFLDLPGAGTTNAVELMAIPLRGLSSGVTRLAVRAGSGVPELAEDFIVAPKSGSDPWTGGDYRLATAELSVTGGCADIRLQLQPVDNGVWRLQFTPCPGRNHTIEFRNTLDSGSWQAWPGAPHNSGTITVTNVTARRFFRVRSETP